jgi:perosamine synthetase
MAECLAIDGGPKSITIPLPSFRNASGRFLGQDEVNLLSEVIWSGELSFLVGKKTDEFEKAFANVFGVNQAVAVSSGTAALHTAMIYLNPEPGDEIIVSPVTDMGSIIPIIAQLAIPVFADIDPATQNLDPNKLETMISPRTRAIIVTHVFGNPAPMDEIMAIARRHNLFVIEDCAQAHMARYKGKLCGTIGNLGCFSFQQSKHMTTGDGGMVISNEDSQFGRKLRQCSDKGWPRDQGGRDHLFLAPNYHMTELQAAVGLAQLGKLDRIVSARIASAERLTSQLKDVDVTPTTILDGCVGTYFFYTFRFHPERLSVRVPQIVKALVAEGLDGFLGYPAAIPIYKYPMVRDHLTFGSSGLPFTLPTARRVWDYSDNLCHESERACKETFCLWWNEGLSNDHADAISVAIRKVMSAYVI